ncbi:putative NAD(P)-binding protein [Chitinophaga skermanii]|uniref:Putative NAD(P)-binding protein n=1 Tax=Chitinophaga skermanii TaxID=331697 RepID=A0A327Q681_9BACT|nr:NAD(P)H-binding protein [Chitinophaga skermanii]RAI99393.1 putative NAD(P)-binding protein [Chitinophaga skermanii]
MQTAIVTGATGLCGKALVQLLLEDNTFNKVRTITRKRLPIDHPKLEQVLVADFEQEEPLKPALQGDALFCCIGTTIKKAGTQANFVKVDLEIPVTVANIAHANGVPQMLVISAVGADAAARNFYLRTKGSMENAVKQVGFAGLHIFRPSLINGQRDERRFTEKLAMNLMHVLNVLLVGNLRKYRSINATTIVKAMLKVYQAHQDGVHIYESDEIEKIVSAAS